MDSKNEFIGDSAKTIELLKITTSAKKITINLAPLVGLEDTKTRRTLVELLSKQIISLTRNGNRKVYLIGEGVDHDILKELIPKELFGE